MQVADHPVGRVEGGAKVVKHPVEVTLEGAAELIKVPLSDMSVGASGRFAVGDSRKGETVHLFFILKEVGVNSVRGFRG